MLNIKITNRFVQNNKLGSRKNSKQWLSFSMITILLISFSMIALYPVLSNAGKISSVELNYNLTKDMERSDAEKDVNEEPVSLFYFEISKVNLQNSFLVLKRRPIIFSIPSVFYDVHILPPKHLIG